MRARLFCAFLIVLGSFVEQIIGHAPASQFEMIPDVPILDRAELECVNVNQVASHIEDLVLRQGNAGLIGDANHKQFALRLYFADDYPLVFQQNSARRVILGAS